MGDGQILIEMVGKDQATQMMVGNLKQLAGQAKQTEQEAGGAFAGMTGKVTAFASAHTAAIVGIAASYVGLRGIREIWSAFKDFAAQESALGKMAVRMNSTVESISSLGYVAVKAGMDSEAFNKALERLQKGASAAALGLEPAHDAVDEAGEPIAKTSKAYTELGINVQKFNQLPIEQKLMVISEAMLKNIDPAARTRIAMELMGKTGGQLIVALAAGPAKIQEWIDRYQQLGGTLTKDGVRAM